MTKRKTKTALGVLPDRYASRTDAIQPSLQTQIAQIQREASQKQNQLDYYLNGSNYIVKPDRFGNIKVYMGDNEEEVPAEFLPRLRASNRYIDMALTPAPEQPTVAPLSNELVQQQRYSPTYQDILRRQKQNVYEYNQAKQQAQTAMSEGLDYMVNPARWYNAVAPIYNRVADSVNKYAGNLLDKADILSKDDVATVGLATMFVPGVQAGKLKGVVDTISKAREYINGLKTASKLSVNAKSLKKIENALTTLEKNPSNANAIRTLRTQFKANPELVADLESAKLFDGMDEFNQIFQPFKIDYSIPNGGNNIARAPLTNKRPYTYEELMDRTLPENRGIIRDGKYWRSSGGKSFPIELKEGDWFLDEHNQIRRVTTKNGKLTDLLDSELVKQRRQQIAAETEIKIKEAEQRGRDAAKKEFENSKPTTEASSSESNADQPKKYAYLPLANGKTVTLEVNGNTAVDPVTGSTFELYPGTTRVKQMDYTPHPSFYQEYGKGWFDIDTGNPAKWKPASKAKAFGQWFYTKAGNSDNPQRLVSNYGMWDFANKDKGRWMNNTREFSPTKAVATGLTLGAIGAGFIQGNGLWGVSKSVGKGAAKTGEAVVFGNDNPFKTSKDSTKTDTLATPSYQEPVDTMDAWGVNEMDAQLASKRQAEQ